VYYASMLRCWHLVWILVWTDHPCLGVGCHNGDLLCSHEKLIYSYALVEATHEVMVTTVKFSQPHTCTCAPHSIDLSCSNSCCSQAKLLCDEHVLVETCDSLIASENDELKREKD
jgi:hypothetical protein